MTRPFVTSILLCAFLCSLHLAEVAQANPALLVKEVKLVGCEEPAVCERIETSLLRVLNELDDLNTVEDYCTPSGFEALKALHSQTQFYCINVLYESRMIAIPGCGYDVRGIRVRTPMGETKGNPDEYLVVSFDQQLLISDVRFAVEERHESPFLERGEDVQDFANRQKILHFIEVFRTAYNRKDIEYLRRVYSDDALIIVGRVLEKADENPDMMKHSNLSSEKIRFVQLSKAEYLAGLERVFQKNDFIEVGFDSLEVVRHSRYKDIYGVTLKQDWNSSTYSDSGYLFLMMDFQNEEQPRIHVRTWQEKPFVDGSVVSLYDFNIL